MARRISMATRSELVEAIVERYRSGSRSDKRLILDEFVAVTGYHRKHAIRVLRQRASEIPGTKRHSLRYGGDVREALVVLWEASERLCSKRLRPLIPVLLPALERHGRLELDAALRGKLLTMSPATMDRLLAEVRVVARGGQRRRAGMSSAVRRSVPIRTFGDWNDPPPGYVEVDFVAHSGTSSSGSFVQTMVLTDIATGWTECVPVRTRESGLVVAAIK
ncbi:MAG: transposase, partial [Mesorhizobium sp.]